MPHIRKQIRDAAVAALAGLATTGARVFKSRAYPFQTAQMPGLLVKTNAEDIEVASACRPRTLERVVELEIEGYAAGDPATIDDTLDAIAFEVEQRLAIAANNSMGGVAKSSTLTGLELEFDDEAEQPHGLIRFKYSVLYHASEATPDVAQ